MKNLVCNTCTNSISITDTKTEFRAISQKPAFIGLYVTCPHCGKEFMAAVMDQEQMDAFKDYHRLNKKIMRMKRGGWRMKSISKLQKQADILQAYMEARSPELMDMYMISQKINERAKLRSKDQKV